MNNLENRIKSYLISNSKKVKINSKDIKKGDVFFALKGSNSHGNKYIGKALSNGAKYVVTDRKSNRSLNNNILKVKNIFDYLQNVATKKRNHFKGVVIAITGSIGKTSIKEFLNFFLSSEGIISASIKSYNNFLGVLISLINMDKDSKFSIFEVGTSNFNEIKKLSSLILPHQVIISNIYPTHLQNFFTTRNIAIEKSDLINPKYNPNIQSVILPNSNEDEVYLKKIAKKYSIKSIITFGKQDKNGYSIEKIENINNFLSNITYKTPTRKIKFKTSTSFKHQILNMLVVVIVYDYNLLNINNFLDKTNNIPFIEGRGLFYKTNINNKEVILIDESYNASPASMNTCIEYFNNFEIKQDQRKIIILGEMLELGKMSKQFLKDIVFKTIDASVDMIIFCGVVYKQILNELSFKSQRIFHTNNEVKILNFLNDNILKNDIILVKSSNLSRVNKLVKLLLRNKKEK